MQVSVSLKAENQEHQGQEVRVPAQQSGRRAESFLLLPFRSLQALSRLNGVPQATWRRAGHLTESTNSDANSCQKHPSRYTRK